MSLLIIGIAAFVLLLLSVCLFSKVDQERGRGKISLDELKDLPLSNPPVLVSQMKNGKVQKTLCYFPPHETAPETSVVEVDVRDQLFARLQPDNTITITA